MNLVKSNWYDGYESGISRKLDLGARRRLLLLPVCREDEGQPNSWLEARRIALDAFQPFALMSTLTHKLKRMHPTTPKDNALLDLCQNLLSPQESGNGAIHI